MSKLLHKELGLCTQAVTWGLLAAALLTMVPGYPILVGTFLICLGIFHSFQYANESNDILYSVLLPVRKSDIVKAKYVKVLLFEGIGFAIMAILTVLRMTLFGAAAPYTANAIKTAWRIGMPFLYFGIAAFLLIGIGEVLHHLPGLTFLNDPAGSRLGIQLGILAAAAAIFAVGTYLSRRTSIRRFEQIDL